MKIQNASIKFDNYNKKSSTTCFKAWYREVYKPSMLVDFIEHPVTRAKIPQAAMELQHKNDTLFFRDGLNFWNKLLDIIATKYKNVQKVNVFNYACSNGSEAYTFIMSLLSKFDNNFANKFFPILAKDYDHFAIKMANESSIPISDTEFSDITKFTNNQFLRFFGESQYFDEQETGYYSTSDELKSKVLFTQADILKDYKSINPSNSIVFARNFWPYIDNDGTRIKFFKNLYEHLDKGCYLEEGTGKANIA